MSWLGRWWRKRQRATDIAILWPACVEKAPSLHAARHVFLVHALRDPAWTEDMTEPEIEAFVDALARRIDPS